MGREHDPHAIDREFTALIKQDPLNVHLRFARGLLQLKMGDFAQGWDAQTTVVPASAPDGSARPSLRVETRATLERAAALRLCVQRFGASPSI